MEEAEEKEEGRRKRRQRVRRGFEESRIVSPPDDGAAECTRALGQSNSPRFKLPSGLVRQPIRIRLPSAPPRAPAGQVQAAAGRAFLSTMRHILPAPVDPKCTAHSLRFSGAYFGLLRLCLVYLSVQNLVIVHSPKSRLISKSNPASCNPRLQAPSVTRAYI
ncbi:hypothetical protein BO78DRAFT_104346 [Aspergillus sclerotiicarbonarius CBS 121057]|uniref:Uncharacterized protein n=1 Tax=Aspergillus sclerotiicarbonarius (strain CBS 121057 / IBT 28362) TaxID=1448318 RepID=A0A319EAP2_ASPSB|nr:hypothetical protein BO78DRAFT_104346 [Aspergillus sclerotiicarbonarius CBS 121057]